MHPVPVWYRGGTAASRRKLYSGSPAPVSSRREQLGFPDALLAVPGLRFALQLRLALLNCGRTLTRIARRWRCRHCVGCGHRGRDGVANEAAGGVRRDGRGERRVAAELVKGVAGIVREGAAVPER